MQKFDYDIIVVGSGPAGLTAGLYATRDGLKTLILGGLKRGGQPTETTIVENYPGFVEGIDGTELVENFAKQAEHWGAEIRDELVTKVEFTDGMRKLNTSEKEYTAKAVILATGSSPRRLGISGEDKFYGRGVSTCATCDGAFYREKEVAVIGGGDTAMEYAAFLSNIAKKIYVIHRRDELRASAVMQERVLAKENVEMKFNFIVTEVNGQDKVESLTLESTADKSTETLTVDGMFLAIGHDPITDYLGNSVELDDHGYVILKEKTMTSAVGVFAAGEVHDNVYHQIVTSAGYGCMATLDAERFIAENF